MEQMTIMEADRVSDHSIEKPPTGCTTAAVSRNVSFVFFFLCFLAFLVAFSTPYWYEDDVEGTTFGLWMTCTMGLYSAQIECERIDVGRPSQLSFKMRALQANMCLAMISNVVSFIMYIVWFCKRLKKGPVLFITIGSHAFAGITTVAAVALFGDYFSYDHGVYGWSFIIACVSGGIQTLTGLITLFVIPFVRG